MSAQRRPDVRAILAQLKDFQQATVERVFERLYGADGTRRFLLADEVGLGKTLVAKGLIAKAIDHMWDDVDRIDIIYICSNADIARQNLTRLHPEHDGFTLPSRVTLLPLNTAQLKHNKLNFVSFTPGTSLEPRSAMGTAEERALLLRMLREPWGLGSAKGPRKLFQGSCRTRASFEWTLGAVDGREMSDELAESFQGAIRGRPDLKARFDALNEIFRWSRDTSRLAQNVKDDRRALIGELRHVLARTCITSLQPDLVILDEFQRFKHLLAGENEASELARELFDWQDEHSDAKARVLLMSATPYKMYTLDGEAEDDHYRDFVATLDFLAGSDRAEAIGASLSEMRRELLGFAPDDDGRLLELHAEVESGLREVMVRTERLGATEDSNGMLHTVKEPSGALLEDDVRDYLLDQAVARIVGEPDVLEYWKSSPYLLNLMGDGYKLVRSVKAAIGSTPIRRELSSVLASARLLNADDLRRWQDVDPGNARMRGLIEDTVASGAWKLLWIPPAMPYYKQAGPFAEPQLQGLTKRLVFSSWKVVPRAVASVVSYAAERELWAASEPDALNTQEVRQARRGRLAFAVTADGRVTGMPALALLYPSSVLASLCDPLDLDGNPALDEVRNWAISRVSPLINSLTADAPLDGPEDETWYWAAPLLLDDVSDDAAAHHWLRRSDAGSAWSGGSQSDGRWIDHVRRAQAVVAGELELGRPPADLIATVAEIGLFGWGTSALRSLSRVATPAVDSAELRTASAKVAWALRGLFNLPEVCAFVPSIAAEGPYWRQCLDYSASGCLQAVLDEFVHLLVESLGYAEGSADAVEDIAERMAATLTLRATRINAEEVLADAETETVTFDTMRLRARFAARFGEESADDGGETTRPDALRGAFNSPFWPFVLASTSVGQEGLDFHHYCHAIVHWNLPPNPVDLEQREGRIHRYKNHAVRKNIAWRYGAEVLHRAGEDPWEALFEAARLDRPVGECDLVPYWLFPLEGGARIERRVPLLPLSRDIQRFDALRRSLAVYRMAFGQSRQEDLVAYLLGRFDDDQVASLVDRLRIDLRPAPVARLPE
ncbi:MAG: hypothetical protein V7607_5867 [Solirubrobacteraceae bacterium]